MTQVLQPIPESPYLPRNILQTNFSPKFISIMSIFAVRLECNTLLHNTPHISEEILPYLSLHENWLIYCIYCQHCQLCIITDKLDSLICQTVLHYKFLFLLRTWSVISRCIHNFQCTVITPSVVNSPHVKNDVVTLPRVLARKFMMS